MPKQKFKDTVTDWMEGTSLRHLRNIPRAPNLWWKLFWIGGFFAIMAAFIWQTVVIVKIYLDPLRKELEVIFTSNLWVIIPKKKSLGWIHIGKERKITERGGLFPF